jgi:hypothetical protein
MIYALVNKDCSQSDASAIANAIKDENAPTLEAFCQHGICVHIQNSSRDVEVYCIYCRGVVRPTKTRSPRGHTAVNDWHFEHVSVNDCVGTTRVSPTAHAIAIENPRSHGCYVELGREAVLGRNRKQCQTIVDGRTYCHLAKPCGCV